MGLWEYADRRKYLANDTIEMCQAAKVDGWLRSRGRYRLQENRDVGIDRCQERSGAGDVVVDRVPINQDLDVKILGTGELQALGVLVPRWTFASIGGQLDIHADDVDQRQDFLELLGSNPLVSSNTPTGGRSSSSIATRKSAWFSGSPPVSATASIGVSRARNAAMRLLRCAAEMGLTPVSGPASPRSTV